MNRLTDRIRQSPLVCFFLLAFIFTWSLLPMASVSISASLLALCGPAFAAGLVSVATSREEQRQFNSRLTAWRISPTWYLLALLLPLPVTAFRSLLEGWLGAEGEMTLQPITPLGLIVFLLVAGEEIGWRGFALPRLLPRFGQAGASLFLGGIWALWHLPLFYIESMPQFGMPFLPYLGYTVALSFILTVLSSRTQGSTIIATLFHGAVNTFGFTTTGTDLDLRGYTNMTCYGLAAVILFVVGRNRQHPR